MNVRFNILRASRRPCHRQGGVALIVGLILLVVATLLGLVGVRGTTLQERMSANLYDRSLAMQASEAALRAAERAITNDPDVGIDCSPAGSNLCPAIPATTFTAVDATWQDVDEALRAGDGLTAGVAQFHIQFMGEATTTGGLSGTRSANQQQYGASGGVPTARFYRVTARSHDPTNAAFVDRALVVLATTVRRNI